MNLTPTVKMCTEPKITGKKRKSVLEDLLGKIVRFGVASGRGVDMDFVELCGGLGRLISYEGELVGFRDVVGDLIGKEKIKFPASITPPDLPENPTYENLVEIFKGSEEYCEEYCPLLIIPTVNLDYIKEYKGL